MKTTLFVQWPKWHVEYKEQMVSNLQLDNSNHMVTTLALLKKMDEDIPPVFMLLDTFEKEVRNLLPGEHLFCVYGDNWFQSVKYNLRVLVAEPRQELLNIWT